MTGSLLIPITPAIAHTQHPFPFVYTLCTGGENVHDFRVPGHTINGDDMKDDKKLLNSIVSTVQMGQIGIRSVLDTPVRNDLRNALQSQLKEYDTIETEAQEIASGRGWELKEVNPAVRSMADMMTKVRLSYGKIDSKVAAMMIQGNTRGMIIGLKDLHQCKQLDSRVKGLSQKLLDCEHANIQQMQGYL